LGGKGGQEQASEKALLKSALAVYQMRNDLSKAMAFEKDYKMLNLSLFRFLVVLLLLFLHQLTCCMVLTAEKKIGKAVRTRDQLISI